MTRPQQLATLVYLLVRLHMSQKQAAAQLGISPRTVQRMVKKHGIKEKMERAGTADYLRGTDRLPAFVAYVRVHRREDYPIVETLYNQFLKTT